MRPVINRLGTDRIEALSKQKYKFSGLETICWLKNRPCRALKIRAELGTRKIGFGIGCVALLILSRMSDCNMAEIPELESKLESALSLKMSKPDLVENKVTENEIADVLSRWSRHTYQNV